MNVVPSNPTEIEIGELIKELSRKHETGMVRVDGNCEGEMECPDTHPWWQTLCSDTASYGLDLSINDERRSSTVFKVFDGKRGMATGGVDIVYKYHDPTNCYFSRKGQHECYSRWDVYIHDTDAGRTIAKGIGIADIPSKELDAKERDNAFYISLIERAMIWYKNSK